MPDDSMHDGNFFLSLGKNKKNIYHGINTCSVNNSKTLYIIGDWQAKS